MVTIRIVKDNKVTNQASFENQLLADEWLTQQIKNKSFGEPESYQIKVEYS